MRCNPSRCVEPIFALQGTLFGSRWGAVFTAEAGLPTPLACVSLRQALTAFASVSGFTCTNTITTPNAMDNWHNPEQTEVPRLISHQDPSMREMTVTTVKDRVEDERRYEAQEQRSTPTTTNDELRLDVGPANVETKESGSDAPDDGAPESLMINPGINSLSGDADSERGGALSPTAAPFQDSLSGKAGQLALQEPMTDDDSVDLNPRSPVKPIPAPEMSELRCGAHSSDGSEPSDKLLNNRGPRQLPSHAEDDAKALPATKTVELASVNPLDHDGSLAPLADGIGDDADPASSDATSGYSVLPRLLSNDVTMAKTEETGAQIEDFNPDSAPSDGDKSTLAPGASTLTSDTTNQDLLTKGPRSGQSDGAPDLAPAVDETLKPKEEPLYGEKRPDKNKLISMLHAAGVSLLIVKKEKGQVEAEVATVPTDNVCSLSDCPPLPEEECTLSPSSEKTETEVDDSLERLTNNSEDSDKMGETGVGLSGDLKSQLEDLLGYSPQSLPKTSLLDIHKSFKDGFGTYGMQTSDPFAKEREELRLHTDWLAHLEQCSQWDHRFETVRRIVKQGFPCFNEKWRTTRGSIFSLGKFSFCYLALADLISDSMEEGHVLVQEGFLRSKEANVAAVQFAKAWCAKKGWETDEAMFDCDGMEFEMHDEHSYNAAIAARRDGLIAEADQQRRLSDELARVHGEYNVTVRANKYVPIFVQRLRGSRDLSKRDVKVNPGTATPIANFELKEAKLKREYYEELAVYKKAKKKKCFRRNPPPTANRTSEERDTSVSVCVTELADLEVSNPFDPLNPLRLNKAVARVAVNPPPSAERAKPTRRAKLNKRRAKAATRDAGAETTSNGEGEANDDSQCPWHVATNHRTKTGRYRRAQQPNCSNPDFHYTTEAPLDVPLRNVQVEMASPEPDIEPQAAPGGKPPALSAGS